jgi:2-dehydropantoate 2-reductase
MIVIGTGPIGGIIGGRLARAGNDMTFVDVDPEHVAAIREKGLQVDVPDGPFNVKINIVYPNEIQGKFDIGFIAVRSNYTSDALATVMPHLSDHGLLVSLQNGINPPLLEERVGPDRTVGVAIRMGSTRPVPGQVRTITRGHLYVGHPHGKKTPQLERLNALLDSVIPSEISDNITGVLWSKLTYTCLGYFGSLADAPLITTCSGNADRHVLVDFFAEVVAVGKAAGGRFIPLAEYNPLDFHPSNPFEKRLAAVNEMAKDGIAMTARGRCQLRGNQNRGRLYTRPRGSRGRQLKISTPLCRKLLDMIHELESSKPALTTKSRRSAASSKT